MFHMLEVMLYLLQSLIIWWVCRAILLFSLSPFLILFSSFSSTFLSSFIGDILANVFFARPHFPVYLFSSLFLSSLSSSPSHIIAGIDVMDSKVPGRQSVEEFFITMRSCFTTYEWQVINSHYDDSTRVHLFFVHWCLKEAYIKAGTYYYYFYFILTFSLIFIFFIHVCELFYYNSAINAFLKLELD